MEYKKIFKSWPFYAVGVVYSLFTIATNIKTYGNITAAEFVGSVFGSFLLTFVIFNTIWLVFKLFTKKNKKT